MCFLKYFLLVIMVTLLSGCGNPQTLEALEEEITDILLREKGVFAVTYHNLSTGEEFAINGHEEFHAASTMKTPVMIEAFTQAHEGKFNLSDSVQIKNHFYSIVDSSIYQLSAEDDSERSLYPLIGSKKTIQDLIYDMIIVSSNLATNLIIDLLDAKEVTKTMRELGAQDIEVRRGVEDIKAFRAGLNNTTTAMDLSIIFSALAREEIVSSHDSKAMINILMEQRFDDIIPAHLPEEVKVAHKTGVISGVHHDSGIVFAPNGQTYVLVLLSKELADFDHGTAVLAGLSKKIFEYVMSK